jgi:hypothetical protein
VVAWLVHTGSELKNDLDSLLVEVATITTEPQRLALSLISESKEERLDPIGEVVLLHEDRRFLAQTGGARLLALKRFRGFGDNLGLNGMVG